MKRVIALRTESVDCPPVVNVVFPFWEQHVSACGTRIEQNCCGRTQQACLGHLTYSLQDKAVLTRK